MSGYEFRPAKIQSMQQLQESLSGFVGNGVMNSTGNTVFVCIHDGTVLEVPTVPGNVWGKQDLRYFQIKQHAHQQPESVVVDVNVSALVKNGYVFVPEVNVCFAFSRNLAVRHHINLPQNIKLSHKDIVDVYGDAIHNAPIKILSNDTKMRLSHLWIAINGKPYSVRVNHKEHVDSGCTVMLGTAVGNYDRYDISIDDLLNRRIVEISDSGTKFVVAVSESEIYKYISEHTVDTTYTHEDVEKAIKKTTDSLARQHSEMKQHLLLTQSENAALTARLDAYVARDFKEKELAHKERAQEAKAAMEEVRYKKEVTGYSETKVAAVSSITKALAAIAAVIASGIGWYVATRSAGSSAIIAAISTVGSVAVGACSYVVNCVKNVFSSVVDWVFG